MSLSELLYALIGGSGIGAIIAAIFSRKTAKEKHKIDLLDRAFKEIERLEKNNRDLKAEIDLIESELNDSKREKYELKRIIRENDSLIESLKKQIDILKGVPNEN